MAIPKHNERQIAAGAERREQVLRLRSQGWTFRQIAAEIGVSPSRAAQIHNRAVCLHRDAPPVEATAVEAHMPLSMLPLSLRTLNALRDSGYETVAQILPLDETKACELLQLPNFGRSCLEELAAITTAK